MPLMRNFRIQFMPADTEKRRKMYCLCGSWSYSLEDVGSVAALHDLVENRQRVSVVCLLLFFDEVDDRLLHARSDLAGAADEELIVRRKGEMSLRRTRSRNRTFAPALYALTTSSLSWEIRLTERVSPALEPEHGITKALTPAHSGNPRTPPYANETPSDNIPSPTVACDLSAALQRKLLPSRANRWPPLEHTKLPGAPIFVGIQRDGER